MAVTHTIYVFEISMINMQTFSVTLNNGRVFQLAFHQEKLIKAVYKDQNFEFSVGQEFCIIFDIMCAKIGTESVVESFCGVLRNKEMDGGQSLEALANRAKIDWSFSLQFYNVKELLTKWSVFTSMGMSPWESRDTTFQYVEIKNL